MMPSSPPQEGIDAANMSGADTDVLIAHGSFAPTTGTYGSGGTAARRATILLKEHANLRGGFLGWNSGAPGTTDANAPDGSYDRTVFSGASVDNYHVVVAEPGSVSNPIVDGCKIRRGLADGTGEQSLGAGVYAKGVNGFMENVLITDNTAVADGGGAYYLGGSGDEFRVRFSHFLENDAERGAGLFIEDEDPDADGAPEAQLCNVVFEDNGNLIQEVGGMPPITEEGGGLYMGPQTTGQLSNCLIHGNAAKKGGGFFHDPSDLLPVNANYYDIFLRHCTVAYNVSQSTGGATGAGIHIAPGQDLTSSGHIRMTIDNCILYGNSLGQDLYYDADASNPGMQVLAHYDDIGSATINGSNYFSTNIITSNPIFIDPAGGDFHLSNNVSIPSPCIDSGSTSLIGPDFLDIDEDPLTTDLPLDLSKLPRVVDVPGVSGTQADRGCYEVQ